MPRRAVLIPLLLLAAAVPAGSTGMHPASSGESRFDVTTDRTPSPVETYLTYANQGPEGLVGNGRSVVRVRPGGFEYFFGGAATGRFSMGGKALASETVTSSTFFPGVVIYRLRGAFPNGPAGLVEVMHGALPGTPYLVAFNIPRDLTPGSFFDLQGAEVSIETHSLADALLVPVVGRRKAAAPGSPAVFLPEMSPRGALLVLCEGQPPVARTWDLLRSELEEPYQKGLQLRTPSAPLDRAVRFNEFLLDLGFDGTMHVCDMFRWRDIWSRDLGSGLAPGAMRSGRFEAARSTIVHDLERHRTWDPRGLRVSEDASKGGSAEGVAWLTRAVYEHYLLSGDREFLADAASTLRPWVESWIARDADDCGLVVDVTDWMDHSRFFLFPDGARVLYGNTLYADLLARFGRIESELGNHSAAVRLAELNRRTAAAINAVLWNDSTGAYDNLDLWGRRDARIASGENALAVLTGVAPPERARRAMQTVRERSWQPAGSTTIFPRMSHVPAYIDHNDHVWPWWNAVEARARFGLGDAEAGVHLLERCAATLSDTAYPGLMEELLTTNGVSEGGHAFLSAAGSFQDAVVLGLLGVEVLEPGCRRLRVEPHTPWRDWSATVPLPRGELQLSAKRGVLSVTVSDPRVEVIEVPGGTRVEGARAASISRPAVRGPKLSPVTPAPPPPLRPRSGVVVFDEPDIPSENVPAECVDGRPRVDSNGLMSLDATTTQAVMVRGSALPLHSRSGGDVRTALSRYLDSGGALVFYGARMGDRGTMGEFSGVIDWYDYRPMLNLQPLGGWKFSVSPDPWATPREKEHGYLHGWHAPGFDDSGWKAIRVPATWESQGYDFDGYGWYRAHRRLPESARGDTLVLDLGRIDDDDFTYVNGELVGSDTGWQTRRRYVLVPGSEIYSRLHFGGDNLIAVQVVDRGGGGGLHADTTHIGIQTGIRAWQPLDAKTGAIAPQPIRHGVISWGPGLRFFDSWETSRGAFGFAVDGHGVRFEPGTPLADLDPGPPANRPVTEAFTQFAAAKPWRFQPLAFTETRRGLLEPDHGERYPCLARVVNVETGGEMILIPKSLADSTLGPRILERLGIRPPR